MRAPNLGGREVFGRGQIPKSGHAAAPRHRAGAAECGPDCAPPARCRPSVRARSCAISRAVAPPCLPAARRQQPVSGQTRQSGLRGRQTVAPSSISAWLKWPGSRGSSHCCAISRKRSRVRPAEISAASLSDPRDHAHHVAVQHRKRQVERDAADRRGGVIADARERPYAVVVPREAAGRRDLLRRQAQIARARVVAQAAPHREHVVFGGRGQRGNRGEALEKALGSTESPPGRGSAAA